MPDTAVEVKLEERQPGLPEETAPSPLQAPIATKLEPVVNGGPPSVAQEIGHFDNLLTGLQNVRTSVSSVIVPSDIPVSSSEVQQSALKDMTELVQRVSANHTDSPLSSLVGLVKSDIQSHPVNETAATPQTAAGGSPAAALYPRAGTPSYPLTPGSQQRPPSHTGAPDTVYVFTTRLLNMATEAVLTGQSSGIVEYHRQHAARSSNELVNLPQPQMQGPPGDMSLDRLNSRQEKMNKLDKLKDVLFRGERGLQHGVPLGGPPGPPGQHSPHLLPPFPPGQHPMMMGPGGLPPGMMPPGGLPHGVGSPGDDPNMTNEQRRWQQLQQQWYMERRMKQQMMIRQGGPMMIDPATGQPLFPPEMGMRPPPGFPPPGFPMEEKKPSRKKASKRKASGDVQLQPVPSPTQLSYLPEFEAQELTITRQLNHAYRPSAAGQMQRPPPGPRPHMMHERHQIPPEFLARGLPPGYAREPPQFLPPEAHRYMDLPGAYGPPPGYHHGIPPSHPDFPGMMSPGPGGHGGLPPGHGVLPPGHGGLPPGHPGLPSGHPGLPSGHGGLPPGHPGLPSGHGGLPPGHGGMPSGPGGGIPGFDVNYIAKNIMEEVQGMGALPCSTGAPPMSMGGNVNHTYVNATMSIQQVNIQNMAPDSANKQQMMQIQQMNFAEHQATGSPVPPASSGSNNPHQGGSVQQSPQPPVSSQSSRAMNVQVHTKKPYTIQYMPVSSGAPEVSSGQQPPSQSEAGAEGQTEYSWSDVPPNAQIFQGQSAQMSSDGSVSLSQAQGVNFMPHSYVM